MPLINCKMYLELNWTKDCVMSNIADTTFKTTSMELYVPIVTLSTKDKVKLTKKLNEGSKRPVYWNKYITKMESKDLNNGNSLQHFILMLLFKELEDCLSLLLTILMVEIKNFKETVTENIFFQV